MIPLNTTRDAVRLRSVVSTLRQPMLMLADRLQNVRPADQVAALFLAAVITAETLGLDAHEEVSRSRRMIEDADGPFTTEVQTLRDYVGGELRRI